MSTFKMNPGWRMTSCARQRGRCSASHLTFSNHLTTYALNLRASIEQIKPAVASAWSRVNDGARITDPELTAFSEAIRTGQGITIRYDGIKK
jgi:hypothetical protein